VAAKKAAAVTVRETRATAETRVVGTVVATWAEACQVASKVEGTREWVAA